MRFTLICQENAKAAYFVQTLHTKMINFNLSILHEHARSKLIFFKAVQNFNANVNVNENKHLLCQRIICLSKSLGFRPNQHLSNEGIKQTKNSRELYWSVIGVQYSVLWRGISDRKLAVPPGLKPLSPEPNWSGNFCFSLAGKILEAKPDSVSIFRDRKLVDASLWASQSFKPRQFS